MGPEILGHSPTLHAPRNRPSPIEFEMAYQVRVAIDRIKFAIKHCEEFGPRTEQRREVGLQLLDALDRLESAERNFQRRFHVPSCVAKSQALSRLADGRGSAGRIGE